MKLYYTDVDITVNEYGQKWISLEGLGITGCKLVNIVSKANSYVALINNIDDNNRAATIRAYNVGAGIALATNVTFRVRVLYMSNNF